MTVVLKGTQLNCGKLLLVLLTILCLKLQIHFLSRSRFAHFSNINELTCCTFNTLIYIICSLMQAENTATHMLKVFSLIKKTLYKVINQIIRNKTTPHTHMICIILISN